MSSQGRAASTVDRRGLRSRYGAARPARRTALMVSLALVLSLGVVSVASASSSFYWYGENNSTCWQTGQPGASSSTCDGVGEWFLNSSPPVRTLEGALNGNLALTESGDYCNAYNLNEGHLYTRDTNNESGLTGFNPSPADTMTDGHGDVCQAIGAQWGQGLRPTAADKYCVEPTTPKVYEPCGMQHYVSFASQKGSLRPWSSAFAGPALVVEGAAYPGKVNVPGGAWAYLCPILEQVGSPHGNLLEYCFVEWQTGDYNQIGKVSQATESGDADGHIMNSVMTAFQLGTSFSTEIAGSGNSYTYGENPWIGPFKAAITGENLKAAIKAANTKYGTGFSENLAEYAVIGVEQGVEGEKITELGEKTENLKLYTEYSNYQPPEASTNAATEVHQEQATLNGTVNPKGTDTHYYFQYGPTTAYGSSTASTDAGAGTSTLNESATVTGIQSSTTYHYRLVATNAGGTVYGSDQTFTTPSPTIAFQNKTNDLALSTNGAGAFTALGMAPGTSPSVAALPSGGYEAAFQANNYALWLYSSSSGTSAATKLGMEERTSPSIAASPGGGYDVAYQTSSGNDLGVYSSVTGLGTNTEQGMLGGTSPSIAALPGGGYVVAFQDNNYDLCIWSSSTGTSVCTVLGMEKGTNPSIAAVPNGGYEVAFQAGGGNDLWVYSSSTGTGTNTEQGMLGGTSPSVATQANGEYDVAFQDNGYDLAIYTPSNGGSTVTSLGMEKGTSPSIAASGNTYEATFQANNGVLWTYSPSTGKGASTYLELDRGTSPVVTALPGGAFVVASQNQSYDLTLSSGSNVNTQQGMAPGTSPSVAALPSGGYEAAFQANNYALWLYSSSSGTSAATKLGMEERTSPSIAASPGGGYDVAYQTSSGNDLGVYSSVTGLGTNTEQGMLGGTSPSIAALPGGGYVVAFQDNNYDLCIWSSSTGTSVCTVLGMEKGTNPSIAAVPNGGYEVAFQAGGGNDLWVYSSSTGTGTNTEQGMLGGTSPSVATQANGEYDVAFQDNGYDLAIYTPSNGGSTVTSLGMEKGTSPSIAASGNTYEATFQANNGTLWVYSSLTGRGTSIYPELDRGTSPSVSG